MKFICFLCGVKKKSVFVCGPEVTCFYRGDRLTWFSFGLSTRTWFLYAGRKSLGINVSTDIDLVFVWVVEVDLISVWSMELDLIIVLG